MTDRDEATPEEVTEMLRHAALQARAAAGRLDAIASILVDTLGDDQGAVRDAVRHRAVARWLQETADHLELWTAAIPSAPRCDLASPGDQSCINAAVSVASTYTEESK